LEERGYFVDKLLSEENALKLLQDILFDNHQIARNMQALQSNFRYKYTLHNMPESWEQTFLPMIQKALPSLFEKTPCKITTTSLLISLEGGEIQPCHVDADKGW
jgi:hypothetical protein